MPEYVVERTAKILLLVVACKKDIDDLRESSALEIIKKLEQEGAIISYYDPYIPEFINNEKEYKSLSKLSEEEIKEKNIIVLLLQHIIKFTMIW